MPSCREIDPLLAPYIDGEIALADKAVVAAHLTACPPCRQRAEAETAARETLRSRMSRPCAPEQLRKRCRKAASPIGRITSTYSASSLSMVAVLVVVGGGVSVYGLTRFSPTVLAAQLTIDHAKCFGLHPGRDAIDVRAADNQLHGDEGRPLRLPAPPPPAG